MIQVGPLGHHGNAPLQLFSSHASTAPVCLNSESLKLAVTFQNKCIIHSTSNSNKAKHVSWKIWKYKEILFSRPEKVYILEY